MSDRLARILAVDDKPENIRLLEAVLTPAGYDVIGASSGEEALAKIGDLKPDLAFLDITMPGLNGLEVAARVVREHPRTRIIILSMHVDDEYVRRALVAGAAGYLLKNSDRSELEMALRAVARGESWLAPEVSSRVVAAYKRGDKPPESGPFELLTRRQREVLQLIAEGLSTKDIAYRLNLSVKTVETHRTELMERLDIHSVAGLVRYAIRVGIVRAET